MIPKKPAPPKKSTIFSLEMPKMWKKYNVNEQAVTSKHRKMS